ncbi:MAG: PEP/pyruvate-binding domain-containing protein [Chloroflexi bacterium]|nr:PEP/pyruvate-binding domain-containing protein [Chloroflexota bacterium]MCA2001385.1 PEP/pyruvate-binding domain-containing protein [Chloroflexota bacterium]
MAFPKVSIDNVLRIFLALNQYPILSRRIRSRMRKELYSRGIITKESLDAETRKKGIESQVREGLHNPLEEEPADVWETRLMRIRDSLTDFYYAHNLPYEEFENLVRQLLSEHGSPESDFVWFNPELAPQEMLFEQAEMLESMPPEERKKYEARLKELKVALIRTLVSDQLKYIKIARKWFTVADLKEIRARKIGGGKIGGKAAGMLLAMRIIKETAPPEVAARFKLPVSFYLGSDVFYNFLTYNNLVHWNDQKYKTDEEMRADYPALKADFQKGEFPVEIVESLENVLQEAGDRPLIVRSSSLLEDNFGTSFAGKYESVFLPNQGSRDEKYYALTRAITAIYASVLNPDALMYRHLKELADYDERIGILIQFVEGERTGRYYFPHAAGVAFSRNLYRWSPQIRQEDGFVRLVFGLGTRAVDMVGDDYPRLVALSHPRLHSSSDVRAIKRYSQRKLDLIDIESNSFATIPVRDVFDADFPPLRFIAQVDEDGDLVPIRSRLADPAKMVVTFDGLLSRTSFAADMRAALKLLETHYKSPVDTEFALEITDLEGRPNALITLLQCRPQSHIQDGMETPIPGDLTEKDIIFSTQTMVPQGAVREIRYVLFVPSEGYFSLESQTERTLLERAIGQLNAALKDEVFIAVGPGRWGTSTPDLGVHVAYSDIYNARALVELAGESVGASPEPSFGTHFFQDLMEANIYPLGVFLDDENTIFKRDFFYDTPNRLGEFLTLDNPRVANALRLIAVSDYRPKHHLDLMMDASKSYAVAFLTGEEEEETESREDETMLSGLPPAKE